MYMHKLTMNFMFPVPDASVPAIEICVQQTHITINMQYAVGLQSHTHTDLDSKYSHLLREISSRYHCSKK